MHETDLPKSLNSTSQEVSLREIADKRLYTAPELMRLTGMTRKQVTYWAKIGLITPTLRNAHAENGQLALFYSSKEVVKALIVCELRRSGFSPRQVQQVGRNLQEQGIQLYESKAYLLTDGYSIYYAFSDGEAVDVLKHHHQMLLLIPIHEQVAKLQEAA
ncbi:MAG: MerR family transcriptional regulator [Ktedonobacteraceae bacterium]